MKLALFGRYIDSIWEGKLNSLFQLLASKEVSFYYHNDFFVFLQEHPSIQVPKGELFSEYENFPEDADIFLSLGGDGTLLDSLSIIRDRKIPVAGINFGRLGFLTFAKVSCGENCWVDKLISKNFKIQKRPLLKLLTREVAPEIYPYALNEITIQRNGPVMIGIDIAINGKLIPTYWADGLLIATPTGSTAYSLSVGGPIVMPESNVLIISPIAPHNLNIRPLIIPDDSNIDIKIHARSSKATLTIDNRSSIISSDHTISLSKGDYYLNTVFTSDSGFFEALTEKLLWGEDKRNINDDE